MDKGLISNIQHFSLGDGPGIRTTVFMQGCNLLCPWCHNPETISPKPRLMFYRNLCAKCGLCEVVCTRGVHSIREGEHFVEVDKCDFCGICEKTCTTKALKVSGRYMSVDEVFDTLYKDYDYMQESGGGVTLSGGEPLLQASFVTALAEKLSKNNIHVIIDTAGNVPYSLFEKVIPHTNTFYFDIKGSSEVYDLIKGDYELVCSNLNKLVQSGCDVVVRIPIIPEINDRVDVMKEVADMLGMAGVGKVSLLPYHNLGISKYFALCEDYSLSGLKEPGEETMKDIANLFIDFHVEIEG